MKPNQHVFVFLLLNALAFSLPHSPAYSGQAKKDAGRSGQANSHINSKGAASNNAQWSADPERGWVRADERQREESREASKSKKNGGKHKANGTKNYDYKK